MPRGAATATTHGTTTTRDQLNFYKLSFEGTRRWRALKLWMSWKHLGTDGFGRLIEANDDLAAHLARRCAESDDFEALPEVPDAVGRLLPPPARRPGRRPLGCPPGELDAHQDRLQRALEVSGDGWLTTTRLRGATYLRAGIVNYLSTEDDIDRLLETLRRLAYAPGSGQRAGRSQRLSIATGAAGRRPPPRSRGARRGRGTRTHPRPAPVGRRGSPRSGRPGRCRARSPPIGGAAARLSSRRVDADAGGRAPSNAVGIAQLERPAGAVDLDVRQLGSPRRRTTP